MNSLTELSGAYCPPVDLLSTPGARSTLHALDSLSSSLLPPTPLPSSILPSNSLNASHLPYRASNTDSHSASTPGLLLPASNSQLLTLNGGLSVTHHNSLNTTHTSSQSVKTHGSSSSKRGEFNQY